MYFAFTDAVNMQLTATDTPDLSAVTDMTAAFANLTNFTGHESMKNWDTSKVTTMSSMFGSATAFNQNISAWDTSKVTTSMYGMFSSATAFNNGEAAGESTAPLNWDTGNVNNMQSMFQNATSFNQPIGSWNTANVANMSQMFNTAKLFNQNINNWDTGKVTAMNSMFSGAIEFNQPIGSWNTANVTSMGYMFFNAKKFNQDIGSWDTGKVTTMSNMFNSATAFNNGGSTKPLNWNTANVTDMQSMFNTATNFNQAIGTWNTGKVKTMYAMFASAKAFNQFIGDWNTDSVTGTGLNSMFSGATSFNNGEAKGVSTKALNWNISNVTSLARTFYSAKAFNQNINSWDTSNVTAFSETFRDASDFNQPLNNWNTGKGTNFSYMFNNAFSFNQPIDSWDMSSATNINNMFSGTVDFNQPIGSWDTSNVTNMSGIFYSAKAFNQDISNWNTANVTTMANMFQFANNFNNGKASGEATTPLDWNTSNVTTMANMFYNATSFNQSVANFNTKNVTNFVSMFAGAKVFNQDISTFDLSSVPDNSSNISGIISSNPEYSVSYYDKLIKQWHAQYANKKLRYSSYLHRYCEAEPERTSLVNNGWSISDGGKNCPLHSLSVSNLDVDESTTAVGNVSAVDPENYTIKYSLVAGEGDEDNAKFTLGASNGTLAFAKAPDWENPTDLGDTPANNTYAIRIRATDNFGSYIEEKFIVTVRDVDDVAPIITITAPTKLSKGLITDTTFTVSDRFSVKSVEVDSSSTVSAEDIICTPATGSTTSSTDFPFINSAPSPTNHLTLNCTLKITSSGKLVLKATDQNNYSSTAAEADYVIDTLGPNFNVANVDTETNGLHKPVVRFRAIDPSGVTKYEVRYIKDNNGTDVSSDWTTEEVTPASGVSQLTINLDPDEAQHAIEIIAYDRAGNTTTRRIVFPPTVTITAPTINSNQTIDDSTVKITSPAEGNEIDNIAISGSASAGVTLNNCTDRNNNTTAPYDTTVTCEIHGIATTGMLIIEAHDITSGAVGNNSQKYTYDIVAPTIKITAPTKAKKDNITDVTISITDDVEIYSDAISIDASSTAGAENLVCATDATDKDRVNCTVTLTQSGSLVIKAVDKAGNSTTKTEADFVIDRTAPTVAINSPSSVTSNNQAEYVLSGTCTTGDGNVTITIGIQPHTATCTNDGKWSLTTDLSTYADGTIVAKAEQTDAVGNETVVSSNLSKDSAAPTATFDNKTINVKSPQLTGSVSETTATIKLKINNQTYSATNNGDGTWKLPAGQISPDLSDGKYTVQVIVSDAVGNEKTYDFTDAVVIDTVQPTVTVNQSSTQADPTNIDRAEFTIKFPEDIDTSTLIESDFKVEGTTGTVTKLTAISNNEFKAEVTGMTSNDTVKLSLDADKVKDLAGNNNTASTSTDNSVHFTTNRPTVAISRATGQSEFTNADSAEFTVKFSKDIKDGEFVASDITVNGSSATITEFTKVSASEYKVKLTGMVNGDNLSIAVPENIATDLAGNQNQASTSSPTVTYDITKPTVTVNQSSTQADPTSVNNIKFTIIFSEKLQADLTKETLALTGATTGSVSNLTKVSDTEYTAEVTDLTSGDTAKLSLDADKVKDLAGNNNTASTSTDNSVTYDATAPAGTINELKSTGNNQPEISGTIDDNNATVTVEVDGKTYNATNNGDGTWSLPAGTIEELALGSHDIKVTFTDTTGNKSTQTNNVTILSKDMNLADQADNQATTDAVNKATINAIAGTCKAGVLGANSLSDNGLTAPEQFVTIIGGITYKLSCEELGGDATVDATLGTYYEDLTKLRIYKQEDQKLIDITSKVNLRNENNTTKLTIKTVDGADYDEDNIKNHEILDPLYVGIYQKPPVVPGTGVGRTTSITLAIIPILISAIALLFNKKFQRVK